VRLLILERYLKEQITNYWWTGDQGLNVDGPCPKSLKAEISGKSLG
jgi:hypothetical protein